MERKEKIAELVKQLSAQFLERENNRTSLITVTNCIISSDLKKATILITVLPEKKEFTALDFAKRKRKDLRKFLQKNMRIKIIPFIDIQIDKGEKNRQRIDELLRNS